MAAFYFPGITHVPWSYPVSSRGDSDSDAEPHRAGLLPEGSHLGGRAASPESLEGGRWSGADADIHASHTCVLVPSPWPGSCDTVWSGSNSSISIKAQHTRATSTPLVVAVRQMCPNEPGCSRMARCRNLAAVCLCGGASYEQFWASVSSAVKGGAT